MTLLTPLDRDLLARAFAQAKRGYEEGGCPIGAVLARGETVLAEGRNRRVQDGDPIAHGEMDAIRQAGRQTSYDGTTMYTTLSPCMMCAGTIVQFGIPRVVIGDAVTFGGNEAFLQSRGVEVILAEDAECQALMAQFIREKPALWAEDIAEEPPAKPACNGGQDMGEDTRQDTATAAKPRLVPGFARNLARKAGSRFDKEIRFFRNWIDQPREVGAVLPTSASTARKMASMVDETSGNPVLELGPGTGVITQAILDKGIHPRNLFSVEYSPRFLPNLRTSFPDVQFYHGDAFDLGTVLPDLGGRKFDAVLSGLPLLNFPVESRVQLLEDLLDRLSPGRPVVQFSYGAKSPIPPNFSTYSVEPLNWMMRNVPPARLWVYRRVTMV